MTIEKPKEDGEEGDIRTYLKLPKAIAPIKAAVFPLLKNKPELVAKAQAVRAMLQKEVSPWIAWDDRHGEDRLSRTSPFWRFLELA